MPYGRKEVGIFVNSLPHAPSLASKRNVKHYLNLMVVFSEIKLSQKECEYSRVTEGMKRKGTAIKLARLSFLSIFLKNFTKQLVAFFIQQMEVSAVETSICFNDCNSECHPSAS